MRDLDQRRGLAVRSPVTATPDLRSRTHLDMGSGDQTRSHCLSPFGNLGAVTLSASVSVLMIRGVKNRYSSVSVVWRSLLPNSPPIRGSPDRIGMPPEFTSR